MITTINEFKQYLKEHLLYSETVYDTKICPKCKNVDVEYLAPLDYKRIQNGDYKRIHKYECKKCKQRFNAI